MLWRKLSKVGKELKSDEMKKYEVRQRFPANVYFYRRESKECIFA